MSDVIFCQTRYQDVGYKSYSDYWRLVELAGYPIIYVDQLDPESDNTYIITPLNDEWLTGWQSPRARIIHHELEWRTDWRAEVNEPPGVAEVWCSDRWMSECIGARYVPLGSDDRLNIANGKYALIHGEAHEVAMIAYQTPRRMAITKQLLDMGINLMQPEAAWGVERSIWLCQSKVMLHVHQHDNIPAIAPLRWCLAAAHKLPLITETVNSGGIFGYSTMMQASYDFLPRFVAQQLRDERLLDNYARALHNMLCAEKTFKKVIEAHV